MFHTHIFGHVVRRLREMAVHGASPNQMLSYLRARCGADEHLQYDYLDAAFLQRRHGFIFNFTIPPFTLLDAEAEKRTAKLIQELRPEWEGQPFPELMRIRDYFSFLEFAKEEQILVTVCGANPWAGAFIDRAGYRCYDGQLFVISRQSEPNRGLIAADPDDPHLLSALHALEPAWSYADYVKELSRLGFRLTGQADGYLIEDSGGTRFYEPYRLHGVYDARTGAPVWTAKRGERLRAAINAKFGSELVLYGPHDDWEHRNSRQVAGPLWGPQLPAIAFGPDHEMEGLLSIQDLARDLRYRHHWERLYPNHPVTP